MIVLCVCVCVLPCSSDVKEKLEKEMTKGIQLGFTYVENMTSAASGRFYKMLINDIIFNIYSIFCLCADVPRRGLHHHIRHPRGRPRPPQRALVVQDEHLVLTDLRHKVEVLLQTHMHQTQHCEHI